MSDRLHGIFEAIKEVLHSGWRGQGQRIRNELYEVLDKKVIAQQILNFPKENLVEKLHN